MKKDWKEGVFTVLDITLLLGGSTTFVYHPVENRVFPRKSFFVSGKHDLMLILSFPFLSKYKCKPPPKKKCYSFQDGNF